MATTAPQTVGVRELRANLGTLLKQVQAGKSLVVLSRGKVVAKIEPPEPVELKPRVLGTMKGQIWMADDWDTWDDDFYEMLEAPL